MSRRRANLLPLFGPSAPWNIPWRPTERPFARLLHALAGTNVERQVVDAERRAPITGHGAAPAEEDQHILEDWLAHARSDLEMFRAGLLQAFRTRPEPISYRSVVEDEDRQAGVLINYLVRTGHASVLTDERGEGDYVYHVEVDWPALERLASSLQIDLSAILRSHH